MDVIRKEYDESQRQMNQKMDKIENLIALLAQNQNQKKQKLSNQKDKTASVLPPSKFPYESWINSVIRRLNGNIFIDIEDYIAILDQITKEVEDHILLTDLTFPLELVNNGKGPRLPFCRYFLLNNCNHQKRYKDNPNMFHSHVQNGQARCHFCVVCFNLFNRVDHHPLVLCPLLKHLDTPQEASNPAPIDDNPQVAVPSLNDAPLVDAPPAIADFDDAMFEDAPPAAGPPHAIIPARPAEIVVLNEADASDASDNVVTGMQQVAII